MIFTWQRYWVTDEHLHLFTAHLLDDRIPPKLSDQYFSNAETNIHFICDFISIFILWKTLKKHKHLIVFERYKYNVHIFCLTDINITCILFDRYKYNN